MKIRGVRNIKINFFWIIVKISEFPCKSPGNLCFAIGVAGVILVPNKM